MGTADAKTALLVAGARVPGLHSASAAVGHGLASELVGVIVALIAVIAWLVMLAGLLMVVGVPVGAAGAWVMRLVRTRKGAGDATDTDTDPEH
jgi:hypothetical protein